MCVKHKKTPSSEASGTVLPWNMPMYRIGDYAKYLGVTPDFLKHYEQFRFVSARPRKMAIVTIPSAKAIKSWNACA